MSRWFLDFHHCSNMRQLEIIQCNLAFFSRRCRIRHFSFDLLPEQARGGLETMQYILLIYDNETELQGKGEAYITKMYRDYGAFSNEVIQSGHFKAGSELQPVSTATTIRVRDGKRLVTDGPFAETKEQLGGYYLIEAADLDEATAIAARIPSAQTGSIEVRPLVVRQGM